MGGHFLVDFCEKEGENTHLYLFVLKIEYIFFLNEFNVEIG